MKNTLRILSVVFAALLSAGLLAACGSTDETQSQPTTTAAPTSEAVGTELFVAPPDAMGKVVAADSDIVTWNAYDIDDKTIDFMGVDVSALKEPSKELSLFYLEDEVSYYIIRDGKLVDAGIEDVVSGAVIGITTLDEGLQEVYILYTPVEDYYGDEEDAQQEIIEEIFVATVATEETYSDVVDDAEP